MQRILQTTRLTSILSHIYGHADGGSVSIFVVCERNENRFGAPPHTYTTSVRTPELLAYSRGASLSFFFRLSSFVRRSCMQSPSPLICQSQSVRIFIYVIYLSSAQPALSFNYCTYYYYYYILRHYNAVKLLTQNICVTFCVLYISVAGWRACCSLFVVIARLNVTWSPRSTRLRCCSLWHTSPKHSERYLMCYAHHHTCVFVLFSFQTGRTNRSVICCGTCFPNAPQPTFVQVNDAPCDCCRIK